MDASDVDFYVVSYVELGGVHLGRLGDSDLLRVDGRGLHTQELAATSSRVIVWLARKTTVSAFGLCLDTDRIGKARLALIALGAVVILQLGKDPVDFALSSSRLGWLTVIAEADGDSFPALDDN